MRKSNNSDWDMYYDLDLTFTDEVVNIDKANRRKRKALKEMSLAIKRKDDEIKTLLAEIKALENRCDELILENDDLNQSLDWEYEMQQKEIDGWYD